jgi:hypothetical protein
LEFGDKVRKIRRATTLPHGEEVRLPKHNLAYQPDRGERGIDHITIHRDISREHLDALQLDVVLERQALVV